MAKRIKRLIVLALGLVMLGAVIFVLCACAAGFDLQSLVSANYDEVKYEVNESFDSISIKTDVAKIDFITSPSGACVVESIRDDHIDYEIAVKDGTLEINMIDNRKWYDYVDFGFDYEKMNVYLPDTIYKTLSIESDTGDIYLPDEFKFETLKIDASTADVVCSSVVTENVEITLSTGDVTYSSGIGGDVSLSASTGKVKVLGSTINSLSINVSTGDVILSDVVASGNVKIDLSTGDLKLTRVTCGDLSSEATTGDTTCADTVVYGKFYVKRGTGDVLFEKADAAEMLIEVSTGDVTGTLLSPKIFYVQTSTGKVDVPKSTEGGICDVTTSTGDVILSIE